MATNVAREIERILSPVITAVARPGETPFTELDQETPAGRMTAVRRMVGALDAVRHAEAQLAKNMRHVRPGSDEEGRILIARHALIRLAVRLELDWSPPRDDAGRALNDLRAIREVARAAA